MKLLKEYARMCITNNCKTCPLRDEALNGCQDFVLKNPEKAARIIKEWSENNPIEIDWTKVPIDTKVMVRNNNESNWEERYFVVYLPYGNRYVTTGLGSKKNDAMFVEHWEQCKLADEIDPTPYLK